MGDGMKPLLKQIPWRTLLAVSCAFSLCMVEIRATLARNPCKPHTAVRFEIAEFSEQLGPCTQVKEMKNTGSHLAANPT
jgi:hypothetical protein